MPSRSLFCVCSLSTSELVESFILNRPQTRAFQAVIELFKCFFNLTGNAAANCSVEKKGSDLGNNFLH